MQINETEAYLLDGEKVKQDNIAFFKNAIGENEVKKIVKELHIEMYVKLQAVKKTFVNENDRLRSAGVGYKDRIKKLGNRYEMAGNWIAKLIEKGKKLTIPPFENWITEDDRELLAKKGLKEFIRFYYQLGYF